MAFETAPPTPLLETFVATLNDWDRPRILELGTRAAERGSWHHKVWAPHGRWTLSDWEAGVDVDVVADAHHLEDAMPAASFDAVVATSLLEHLQRPWVAVASMARMLDSGGVLYLTTHQTFPLHYYNLDTFRFGADGMRVLIEDAGLEVLGVGFAHPCTITPKVRIEPWDESAEAYLTVEALGRRAP